MKQSLGRQIIGDFWGVVKKARKKLAGLRAKIAKAFEDAYVDPYVHWWPDNGSLVA